MIVKLQRVILTSAYKSMVAEFSDRNIRYEGATGYISNSHQKEALTERLAIDRNRRVFSHCNLSDMMYYLAKSLKESTVMLVKYGSYMPHLSTNLDIPDLVSYLSITQHWVEWLCRVPEAYSESNAVHAKNLCLMIGTRICHYMAELWGTYLGVLTKYLYLI